MIADDMLSSERQQPPAPGRSTSRSPILLLEDADRSDPFARSGDVIAAMSVHAVARDRSAALATKGRPYSGHAALLALSRLQDQFEASCIGLVAEPGRGLASARLILEECRVDGNAPGAIVLLGFSPDFFATCMLLGGAPATAPGAGTKGQDVAAPRAAALFEWPPMVIFLPEDDHSIGECAGACRAMRSLAIPIRLEITRSMQGTADRRSIAMAELVCEIDRFFAENLTPYYPRLL